jgi:hypothetical protein
MEMYFSRQKPYYQTIVAEALLQTPNGVFSTIKFYSVSQGGPTIIITTCSPTTSAPSFLIEQAPNWFIGVEVGRSWFEHYQSPQPT